ncbi:permease [Paracoccus sp. p4-l81]|uniref:permease n=1 Tax=Paracoccus sp. p3-h83 TaxID=3342805 RepID=UPI0035B82F00
MPGVPGLAMTDGPGEAILLPDGAPAAGPQVPSLTVAEALFGAAASEMTRLLRRLEAGDAIRPKEASDAAAETRKALERLQDERSRVEQLRRNLAGAVGGGQLDLGAARDEIGRRLACLRHARGD